MTNVNWQTTHRNKALLLENVHQAAVNFFQQKGYEVEFIDRALSKAELMAKLADYTILGVKSKTKIDAEVLQQARHLKCVLLFATGFDNVDVKTANELGIPVFNAPNANTRSVVELVVAEMVLLLRRVYDRSVALKNGIWQKDWRNCWEAQGKNLGIIGYGNIGSQVGQLAEAFGFRVFYYDVFDKSPVGQATKCDSIEELLQYADVVSLHTFAPSGKPVFTREHFQAARKNFVILNFSRGSALDYEALVEFIKNGKVIGAGIDVFPEEPEVNGPGFYHELQQLPNVILTPHIGGSTEEAQERIAEQIIQVLDSYLTTGDTSRAIKVV